MDNSEHRETSELHETSNTQSSWLIIGLIILLVIALSIWFVTKNEPSDDVIIPTEVIVEPTVFEEPIIVEEVEVVEDLSPVASATEYPESEVEPIEEITLPVLNKSDQWVSEQLTTLTWRKELLKLVIDEDIIRRLVVFTDNFSKGTLAYKFSPLVAPNSTFTAIESDSEIPSGDQEWIWDPQSEKRFDLYIELLRSLDSDSLIEYYHEIKPLINEAYRELGYQDIDFTDTLQIAIDRILDAELPKTPPKIIRPSVMYKYEDKQLEALDDVDKLLIRLGKENVLLIKSILLEFSEKLSAEENQ